MARSPTHTVADKTRSRVGSTLCDKWTIESLLGRGGMATVYAARHRNGHRVAIKLLHPEISADETLRQRFLREGYAANAVGHPGVVRVLDDDFDDDGIVFMVMELLEGESLDCRLRRAGGRLDAQTVVDIGARLLDVLAAAHDKGIIHRDIKPQNIFLTSEGVLKVLDFGIARMLDPSASGIQMTKTGASMGSPPYMPPEQARGRWEQVDARSDLWAAGATLFRLLTGRFVHDGETAGEMLLAAMTQQAPAVCSVAPDVPQALGAVVDRALAFDKNGRFSDARAMRCALCTAALSSTAPLVAREAVRPSSPLLPVTAPDFSLDSASPSPTVEVPPAPAPQAAPGKTTVPLSPNLALLAQSALASRQIRAEEEPWRSSAPALPPPVDSKSASTGGAWGNTQPDAHSVARAAHTRLLWGMSALAVILLAIVIIVLRTRTGGDSAVTEATTDSTSFEPAPSVVPAADASDAPALPLTEPAAPTLSPKAPAAAETATTATTASPSASADAPRPQGTRSPKTASPPRDKTPRTPKGDGLF